jgi:hypothetical protein
MCALRDTASEQLQFELFRRLIRVAMANVLVAAVWPAALSVALPAAGFYLAHLTIRIVPRTTVDSIEILLLLAVSSALVLTGPWAWLLAENSSESRAIDLLCLPMLFFGASRPFSIGAWLGIVALASWLTFARESIWVQAGVLLISLSPWPIILLMGMAMRNA